MRNDNKVGQEIARQMFEVAIQDGISREPIAAVVEEGISEQDARAVDQSWQPALYKLLGRLATECPDDFEAPQHWHWKWGKKVAAMRSAGIDCAFFALEADNEKQGMMAVEIGRSCRIAEQEGAPLIYVEFISTAPWNLTDLLKKLNEKPRYRAVGAVLLTVAIEYSQRKGFDGRIGLHALEQAEDFYRDGCKMTDLGQDTNHDQKLRYFEFTVEQAEAFLRGE